MTTTAAPATRRPKPAPVEDDDGVDDFRISIVEKAQRFLATRATPADGKETKATAAWRVQKEFWEKYVIPALDFVRGEVAENRGEIDECFDRLDAIDPPDLFAYLQLQQGFGMATDAYVKHLLETGGFGEMVGEGKNAEFKFNDPKEKERFEAFLVVFTQSAQETEKLLAEYDDGEDGPEDDDEEDDADDDDDEGDSDEGVPVEDKKSDAAPSA